MQIVPDDIWSNPGGITVENGEGDLTTDGTTTWAIRVHDEEFTPTCNYDGPDVYIGNVADAVHVTDSDVLGYWSGNPSSFWIFSHDDFPIGTTIVYCNVYDALKI